MKRLAAAGLAALAASRGLASASSGGPAGRAVYCWQNAKGEWSLQRFKPLINAQGGTVFAEMSFLGPALAEVRVRRFDTTSELALEYSFDAAGKLVTLRGSVTVKSVPPAGVAVGERMVLADWVGEAELTPGADGKIPPHHVLYTREKDKIDKPDDAEKYVAQFDSAPVYKTTASVPCAAMMKDAERINATQE